MEQFTKYPLFGKAYIIKDDVFNDWCYREPGAGCTVSPVIGSAVSTQNNVQVRNNTPVRPFSNGSGADYWMNHNCHDCERFNCEASNPDALREYGGCPLEMRLGLAWVGDGKIPFKTAKRIGFKSLSVQENGVFVCLSDCKEKI